MLKKQKSQSKPSNYANQQVRLVLIAGLPGSVLALIALTFTNASYYLISFVGIILALLIAFAAISGRQKADYQIRTLSNLIEAMIDGDYTLRGRRQKSPAFQHLLTLINQLANTLQQQKLKVEEKQLLFNKVIEQMDALIIATAPSGQVVILNASAKQLLNHPNKHPITLDDLSLTELKRQDKDVIHLEHNQVSGEYIVYRDQFISDNQPHQLFLLTKAEELLRRKEREDWQRLLRVLSHEINNSLAPIATFTGTMLRKIEKEHAVTDLERFTNGLQIVQSRAESLNQFVRSYSQLTQLPAPDLKPILWFERMKKLSLLFPSCTFTFEIEPSIENLSIKADAHQFEQVIINLFKNAVESMTDIDEKQIKISAQVENQYLVLCLWDNGTGIANPDNLFVPFYTTKPSGSGIGLTLCRQIMLAHQGSISITNRKDKPGAQATLKFNLHRKD